MVCSVPQTITMQCIFCKKTIPIFRRLKDAEFCSDAHRKQYVQEQSFMAMRRLVTNRGGESTRVHNTSVGLKAIALTTLEESRELAAELSSSAYTAALEAAHQMANVGAPASGNRQGSAPAHREVNYSAAPSLDECPSDDLLFDALSELSVAFEASPEIADHTSEVVENRQASAEISLATAQSEIDECPSDDLLFDALSNMNFQAEPPLPAPPAPAARQAKPFVKGLLPTISVRQHGTLDQFQQNAVRGSLRLLLSKVPILFSPRITPVRLKVISRRKRGGLVTFPISPKALREAHHFGRTAGVPVTWSARTELQLPLLSLLVDSVLVAPPPPLANRADLRFVNPARTSIATPQLQQADLLAWPEFAAAIQPLGLAIDGELRIPPPPIAAPVQSIFAIAARSIVVQLDVPVQSDPAAMEPKLLPCNQQAELLTNLPVGASGSVGFTIASRSAASAFISDVAGELPFVPQSAIPSPRIALESELRDATPVQSIFVIGARCILVPIDVPAPIDCAPLASKVMPCDHPAQLFTELPVSGSSSVVFAIASRSTVCLNVAEEIEFVPRLAVPSLSFVIDSELHPPPPPFAKPVQSNFVITARSISVPLKAPVPSDWTALQPVLVSYDQPAELLTDLPVGGSGSVVFAIAGRSASFSNVVEDIPFVPQLALPFLRFVIDSELRPPPPPFAKPMQSIFVIAARSSSVQLDAPVPSDWAALQQALPPCDQPAELLTDLPVAESGSVVFAIAGRSAVFSNVVEDIPFVPQLALPSLRFVIDSELHPPPPPFAKPVQGNFVIAAKEISVQLQGDWAVWTPIPQLLARLQFAIESDLVIPPPPIAGRVHFAPTPLASDPLRLNNLGSESVPFAVLVALPQRELSGLPQNLTTAQLQESAPRMGKTLPKQDLLAEFVDFELSASMLSERTTSVILPSPVLAESTAQKPVFPNLESKAIHLELSSLVEHLRSLHTESMSLVVPNSDLWTINNSKWQEQAFAFGLQKIDLPQRTESLVCAAAAGASATLWGDPVSRIPNSGTSTELAFGSKWQVFASMKALEPTPRHDVASFRDGYGQPVPFFDRATRSNRKSGADIFLARIPAPAIAPELEWPEIADFLTDTSIPPFANLVALPTLKLARTSRFRLDNSLGPLQVLITPMKLNSGLSVAPFVRPDKPAEEVLRQKLDEKQPSSGFSLFLLKAPADLKWITLSLPVILGVWLFTSARSHQKPEVSKGPPTEIAGVSEPGDVLPEKTADKVIGSDQKIATTPANEVEEIIATGKRVPVASGDSWDKFKQRIAYRSAVAYEDDFHSGLSQWAGRGGWAGTWGYDKTGLVRIGQLAVFSPSMSMTDYHYEVTVSLDRHSFGWIYRAMDLNNYYAARLVMTRPGPVPTVALERYAVVGGKHMKSQFIPIPLSQQVDSIFTVSMDVAGNSFTTSVQGQIVDSFSDDRFGYGGVGLFSGRGEESRVFRISLTHNNDTFGRLCAMIAPYESVTSGSSKK